MFVVSLRASTVRFFAVAILALAVLVGTLAIGGGAVVASAEEVKDIRFSGRKTNEERIDFLKSFGIEVEAEPTEEEAFTIPENFDRVLAGYNELQKSMGLDLAKYTKKKVTRYTYRVTNCTLTDGDVLASLLICRGRVIGCDVSTADPAGFVIAPTEFR